MIPPPPFPSELHIRPQLVRNVHEYKLNKLCMSEMCPLTVPYDLGYGEIVRPEDRVEVKEKKLWNEEALDEVDRVLYRGRMPTPPKVEEKKDEKPVGRERMEEEKRSVVIDLDLQNKKK